MESCVTNKQNETDVVKYIVSDCEDFCQHFTSHCKALNHIKSLLSHGFVNKQDTRGRTALHVLVRYRKWDLVPLLLQHGADTNVQDNDKSTPLHYAVYDAPFDVINQLTTPQNINMVVNIPTCCVGGHSHSTTKTPLQYALVRERLNIVAFILEHGANVHISDIALYAISCKNIEFIGMLLQYIHVSCPVLVQAVQCDISQPDSYSALNVYLDNLKQQHTLVTERSLNLVCPILQYTCTRVGVMSDKLDRHKYVNNMSKQITEKKEEFEDMSHQPAPLKKQCMITVRKNLLCKSDKNFASLGLPPQLLSYVKLRDLADELLEEWHNE